MSINAIKTEKEYKYENGRHEPLRFNIHNDFKSEKLSETKKHLLRARERAKEYRWKRQQRIIRRNWHDPSNHPLNIRLATALHVPGRNNANRMPLQMIMNASDHIILN